MSIMSDMPPGPMLRPAALLELIKPITWFPPMWAYLCGVVSVGVALGPAGPAQWGLVLLGLLIAGPVVCGMSQAANDWCDRYVDAINEPGRPIPSGRVPGRVGLHVAWIMSAASLGLGTLLGPWGFAAVCAAVAAAWIYSAEPLRLKRSGVWGPGLVALCYEGLPWFTGAAVTAGALPRWEVIAVAALYAAGAHGIMTLNDFKAIEGDRATGVRSLPAVLGPRRAAGIACFVMAVPQVVVVLALDLLDRPWHALAVGVLLAVQLWAMRAMIADPRGRAAWYNKTGVTLYVAGMMVAAFGLRGLA